MDAILNNPYRILGLEPTNDESIIAERVSEILGLLTNGEKVSLPIDEFYNKILVDAYNTQYYNSLATNKGEPIPTRNIETVKIAYEKLQDPIKRKYYALFAFEFDKTYRGLDADELIKAIESELLIEEKRINRLSHTFSTDFLNHCSETEKTDYIIEKEYNSLKIVNLIENGTFIKPGVIIDKIPQEENFSLEFECKWIEGIDNSIFSVFWGKDTFKSSYYSFGLSGNGYFYLSNNEDGKRIENDVDFTGWKKSDAVKQHGHNHLEFRRNMDCIEFYINYTLVHKTNTFRSFYGKDYGFIVFGKQTVVFSDLKINSYKEDIDYASNLIINIANFKKVKNLAIHFFFKTYLSLNQPLTYTSSKSDIKNVGYTPSTLRLSLDKALILFGKLFQKQILFSVGFFSENMETENCWEDLAQLFFDDLDLILELSFDKDKELKNNGIHFEERFQDPTLRQIEDNYSLAQLDANFFNWKSKLVQFPQKTENDDYQFDIELFRKAKFSKSHFSGTINNPFRILALKYDATDKEIAKRVSDLLVYVEMGKTPKYETDLFFGDINRTIENIRDAEKKLENPNHKLYHALLWFVELNELDKAFINKIQTLDKGENTLEFKSEFIRRAPDLLENKINYFDAVKSVYEGMFLNALSLNEKFIDNRQIESEEISFCVYDDIISAIPLNDNSVRINNQLVFNSNIDDRFWLLKETYFDYKVDYEIEFECEWLEGEDTNKLYSIIFSKDSGNNYYQFGMAANGNLFFDAFVNGIIQNLFGWRQRDNLNIESKNKLKIAYNSDSNKFVFYINEKRVFENGHLFGIKALEKPLAGIFIGVSVFGKQKVSFSNLKLSYSHRISKPVSKFKIRYSKISNVINYMTANFDCSSFMKGVYHHLPPTITLFGKIINSDELHLFASKVIGEHGNFDIKVIEKYFIDDVFSFSKPQFDTKEYLKLDAFIDAFYSFSDMNQNYIVHKFIGRPILEIENSIKKTKDFLKNTPLQGLILGSNLYNSTNEDLITVRKILSYTNYQYRLLANNLSDSLLDCGIVFFNTTQKNREVLLSEGNQILELVHYANTIAIDGNARKRVDENMSFFIKWISDAQKREQERFKQGQSKQNQEREKLRKDQEIHRQEQERERLRKEEESKRNKTKPSFNQTINIPLNKPNIGKQIFQKLKKIVPIYFWYIVFVIIILCVVLIPDNKKDLSSNNVIAKDSKPTEKSTESYTPINNKSDLDVNLSNYKPMQQQAEVVEESKWKGNKLNNGDSPYNGYFGNGVYDNNSECYLIFKNGYSTDAIVCLENTATSRTIRNEYIQAGTDYKMTNIPEGIYKVKTFSGNDWNPEKTLNHGEINGAFDTDLSFSTSDNPSDLIQMSITETGDGISYSTGEITLYRVSHGNMQQRNINSDEFFK